VGGHRRSGRGFDDARLEMVVLVVVGVELLDVDDVVAGVVVRVVVELVLGRVETELGLGDMMVRRDGDVSLYLMLLLLVLEVLSTAWVVVPWRVRFVSLVHFSTVRAGWDELPFVGLAGGAAVFDEVEAFAPGAVFVFAHAFFDFDAAF